MPTDRKPGFVSGVDIVSNEGRLPRPSTRLGQLLCRCCLAARWCADVTSAGLRTRWPSAKMRGEANVGVVASELGGVGKARNASARSAAPQHGAQNTAVQQSSSPAERARRRMFAAWINHQMHRLSSLAAQTEPGRKRSLPTSQGPPATYHKPHITSHMPQATCHKPHPTSAIPPATSTSHIHGCSCLDPTSAPQAPPGPTLYASGPYLLVLTEIHAGSQPNSMRALPLQKMQMRPKTVRHVPPPDDAQR